MIITNLMNNKICIRHFTRKKLNGLVRNKSVCMRSALACHWDNKIDSECPVRCDARLPYTHSAWNNKANLLSHSLHRYILIIIVFWPFVIHYQWLYLLIVFCHTTVHRQSRQPSDFLFDKRRALDIFEWITRRLCQGGVPYRLLAR